MTLVQRPRLRRMTRDGKRFLIVRTSAADFSDPPVPEEGDTVLGPYDYIYSDEVGDDGHVRFAMRRGNGRFAVYRGEEHGPYGTVERLRVIGGKICFIGRNLGSAGDQEPCSYVIHGKKVHGPFGIIDPSSLRDRGDGTPDFFVYAPYVEGGEDEGDWFSSLAS